MTGRFLMGRLRHALSEQEKRTVESLIVETMDLSKPQRILKRGDLCERSTFLIDGFMLRTITDNGRRHIVGIQVPGDFVDLHAFALKRLDHDVITVGPARLGVTTHDRLEQVMDEQPHLARILWFSTLLDASIHRQWILRLEQLPAAPRVAHVFAELWHRLDLVGLTEDRGVNTPLTQADLADICGTTTIHMNRALSTLRKEGIGDFRRGNLTVQDRPRLEEFARFDPTYLYGRGDLNVGDALAR